MGYASFRVGEISTALGDVTLWEVSAHGLGLGTAAQSFHPQVLHTDAPYIHDQGFYATLDTVLLLFR